MLLPFILQATFHVEGYTVEGVRREALVFTGQGAAPPAGRPLILVFHGHGGNMNQASRSFRAHTIWPEATVIYPNGLPSKGAFTDPEGKRQGWQMRPGVSEDRDLKLVDAILGEQKGIDRKRVFAMGHSNGGRMVYVLWAARADRFAAYGPSGSPAMPMALRFRPAPMFATAGEADPLISYASQRRSIEAIARLDGVDLSKGVKEGYATLARGTGGLEFGTYIHPGGHEYPRLAAEATVAFFKRYAPR